MASGPAPKLNGQPSFRVEDDEDDLVVYDASSLDRRAAAGSSSSATASYPPPPSRATGSSLSAQGEDATFANVRTPTSASIGQQIAGLFSPGKARRSSSWKGKGKAEEQANATEGKEGNAVLFDAPGYVRETDDEGGIAGNRRAASRSSTESLTFAYRDHLLPLSLSLSASGAAGDDLEDYESEGDYSSDDFEVHTLESGGSKYEALEVEEGEEEQGLVAGQERSPSVPLSSKPTSHRHGKRKRRRKARARTTSAALERRMTLLDGISLTVGLQIGSGIFSSPGVVTLNAGSVGASLLVWLTSGILAWTGASSFAELGSAIPLNGGAQAYLNYSFGPLAGYLFAWTAITALKPGSGAIIAIIFGEYIARVIFHAGAASKALLKGGAQAGEGEGSGVPHPHEQGLQDIPQWSIKLIAISVTVLISLLQSLSNKLGTRTQNATTVIKLLSLAAVPVLAIVAAARGKMPEESKLAFSSLKDLFEGSAKSPGAYALALYSGLWSFDGWDQASYVAGEMKSVGRDLPRVINVSLAMVLSIFLLTVTSYFLILPPKLVARTNTVALDYGSALLGSTGGIAFALLVAFSCFGALNSQFYTTARLVYAAGKEGYLPSLFGRLSARRKTPVYALVLQNALVALFILFGSGFASLVNFYGVCSWLFYFLTVCGLLVLRVKEPNLERPYRTWLTTPILFATVALFLLLMPIFSAPLEALAAFGFIGAGVPVFFITQRRHYRAAGAQGGWMEALGGLTPSCCGGRRQGRSAGERRPQGEMAEREGGSGQGLLASNGDVSAAERFGPKSGAKGKGREEESLEMKARS